MSVCRASFTLVPDTLDAPGTGDSFTVIVVGSRKNACATAMSLAL